MPIDRDDSQLAPDSRLNPDPHLDLDAQWYGRFLVGIAALDTRVSEAVAKITGSLFEVVHYMPFHQRIKWIRKYARKIAKKAGNPDTLQGRNYHTCLLTLEHSLDDAENVQQWRNIRVHARVRFDNDTSISLTDSNGNPIDFSSQSFRDRLKRALHASCAIAAYLDQFIRFENPDDEWFRLMNEGIPDLSNEDYAKSLAELRAELQAAAPIQEQPKQNS